LEKDGDKDYEKVDVWLLGTNTLSVILKTPLKLLKEDGDDKYTLNVGKL